jgi:hypothetical protein
MKVFLACITSCSSKENRKEFLKKNKPLYLLESFYSGEKVCKEVLDIVGIDNFLLDSGAFSYMNGVKSTKEELEIYLEEYIKFINKYDIKYFFELDVDVIFGIDFVERLRKRLEEGTGKKCIPVWHKSRGIEYWKTMVENYDYIAIGGLAIKHIKKKEYPLIRKMVDYAYSKGVKVHGLGFTQTKELSKYKFYSVDSSSWLSSVSRGQVLNYFNGYTMQNKKLDKGNKKVVISKMLEFNLKEWIKFQKYAEKNL